MVRTKKKRIDNKKTIKKESAIKLDDFSLESQTPEQKLPEEVSKPSRTEKELYWIFGVMISLIIVFLISYSVFQSLNKFQYNGLTFQKEKFGDIPLYRYSYLTQITGQVIGSNQVNLYLRNDPRENNVPIEGEIEFLQGKPIYVSINGTGLLQCEYSSVALANLASFLTSNGFSVKGAVPDKEEAEKNKIPYAACENLSDNIVILVQSGEETKITKENNCYVITASKCEILPATEKFTVQAILDARARAERGF